MRNDLAHLFAGTGRYHRVENYWEAAGLIMALQAGIAPETVRRDANGELASIADGLSRLGARRPYSGAVTEVGEVDVSSGTSRPLA